MSSPSHHFLDLATRLRTRLGLNRGYRFGITSPDVEDYLYRSLQPRRRTLARMEREAADFGIPIVGPLVGQFLYQIARVSRSKRILEIGMAIGYSTIWLAQAAKWNKGNVTSIEIEPEMVERARSNLREEKLNDIVRIIVGDAIAVIEQLKSKFDLMFIDADKTDYPRLLDPLSRLMRKGTILLADNTLWSGAVATDDRSETTAALRRFNELVMTNPLLESVIVPIRDGVTFAVRR